MLATVTTIIGEFSNCYDFFELPDLYGKALLINLINQVHFHPNGFSGEQCEQNKLVPLKYRATTTVLILHCTKNEVFQKGFLR